LNACVLNPAEGSAPAGAYDAKAENAGVRVPPKEKKKAPYEAKTTEGKVFPRNHSIMEASMRRRPPKK